MWHLKTRFSAAPGQSIKETPVPRTAHSNPAKSPVEGPAGRSRRPHPNVRLWSWTLTFWRARRDGKHGAVPPSPPRPDPHRGGQSAVRDPPPGGRLMVQVKTPFLDG